MTGSEAGSADDPGGRSTAGEWMMGVDLPACVDGGVDGGRGGTHVWMIRARMERG